jgi:serine protease Do
MAVGSPFGLSQTVTAGIISATERENLDINRFESFIQTDASINPGNSGGPLVGMDGKVIGINSAIATSSRSNAGVGFAIPIDMAVRVADKLIQKGKITPMVMGVQVEPLARGLAKSLSIDVHTSGVLVDEVVPGSPAEKAGLKQGDVITTFDGQPVRTREGLQYLVSTSDSGKSYTVHYLRDGRSNSVTITPVDRQALLASVSPKSGTPEPESKGEIQGTEGDGFGLSVTPLTPTLAKRFGYDSQLSGLVVTKVAQGGPAQESGIEVGDLITKVVKDSKIRPAASVEEFEDLVKHSDEINVFLEDVNHKLPGEFKTLTKEPAAAK